MTLSHSPHHPFHRQILLLSGERRWCLEQIPAFASPPLWVSNHPPTDAVSVQAAQRFSLLGEEHHHVILDLFDGFDADLFGAISGVIRGGGCLVLIAPPLQDWHQQHDPEAARVAVYPTPAEAVSRHFMQRLIRHLQHADGVIIAQQPAVTPKGISTLPMPSPPFQLNSAQQCGVNTIHQLFDAEKPHQCVVLTADRGRGKSSVLGIVAAQLLQQHAGITLIVTAPRLKAVSTLFQHLHRSLPDIAHVDKKSAKIGTSQIHFLSPDELLNERPDADMVIVDEAAAIPVPMLLGIQAHYHASVFSTTVHGYEGTGRGFSLRFEKALNQQSHHWQKIELTQPVRWAENDPLEALSYRLLLLNAEADTPSPRHAPEAAIRITEISQYELTHDETKLRSLFGLLVNAHYQTRPNDLRQILDGPNIRLFLMQQAGCLLGAALVAIEGGFDAALSQAIYAGKRRPMGHLLPQSLCHHSGFVDAASLTCARVIRIAILPEYQQQRLGSRFLNHLQHTFQQEGIDYLGTSFGATTPLLNFWSNNGYQPLRLGISRNAVTGSHALLMGKPLSRHAVSMLNTISCRFQSQLSTQRQDPLITLDSAVYNALCALPSIEADGDQRVQDRKDIQSFIHAERGYELNYTSLLQFVESLTASATVMLTTDQKALLDAKLIQHKPWKQCADQLGYTGRKQAEQAMREIITSLFLANQ